MGHYNGNTVNAQFIAGDLEYGVNAITLQVIDVVKICNSAQVGPSTSWALVLCTCCTIHCYATERQLTLTSTIDPFEGIKWVFMLHSDDDDSDNDDDDDDDSNNNNNGNDELWISESIIRI